VYRFQDDDAAKVRLLPRRADNSSHMIEQLFHRHTGVGRVVATGTFDLHRLVREPGDLGTFQDLRRFVQQTDRQLAFHDASVIAAGTRTSDDTSMVIRMGWNRG
jgi:hypothetical protein